MNDSLVEGSTDDLKNAIVKEAENDDSVTITEDYQFDFLLFGPGGHKQRQCLRNNQSAFGDLLALS